MGSLFEADVQNVSGLSGIQQQVQQLLGQLLSGGLSNFPSGAQGELAGRLLGLPIADPDNVFAGFLAPSLRAFDQEIAPRIREGFAGQGASFSSRRGEALSRTLGDIQTQAQSQFITQNIPLQQLLGQIGGINQLLNPALGFSTATTQSSIASPGIGTQLLGLAGTLGGAALGGGKGGGGAGAIGAPVAGIPPAGGGIK